jgi:mannosyltransferase
MTVEAGKEKTYITLSMLMIIGFALRYYRLGFSSIWIDEGWSIYFSRFDFKQIIHIKDDFTPLYYALLHGWTMLFGDSEASVRFLSLIFGVLSIGAIYKIGVLLLNKEKGIWAALLVAASRFQLHYSQEARMYSLMAFLTLVSMYYFIKLIKGGGRTVSAGYTLSSIVLIYCHVYGLFVIFAQNLYFMILFWFDRKYSAINLKRWFLLQTIIVLFFAPWVPTFIARASDNSRAIWLQVPTMKTMLKTFIYYSGSWLLLLVYTPLIILALVSFGIRSEIIGKTPSWYALGGFKFRPRLILTRDNNLLLLWLMTPIVLPILLSQFMAPFYSQRYTIAASLAFLLLIASGIGNLRPRAIKIAVIGMLVCLWILNVKAYYDHMPHEHWRQVAQYVDKNSKQDDLVLFNKSAARDVAFNYYSKSRLTKKVISEDSDPVDTRNDRLVRLIGNHDRVWVVLSHPEDDFFLVNALCAQFRYVYYERYRSIRLYLFERKKRSSSAVSPSGLRLPRLSSSCPS